MGVERKSQYKIKEKDNQTFQNQTGPATFFIVHNV